MDCRLERTFSNSCSSLHSQSPLNPTKREICAVPPLGAKCRERPPPGTPSFPSLAFSRIRRRAGVIQVPKAESADSNAKIANLSARRKETVKLPNYDEGYGRMYPISEFLTHPSGVEAILNTRVLQSFQSLDSNTYRCTLPKIKLLNFEVAPMLDLRVTPTSEDCTVEMLSCKFEGSEYIEHQNDRFSAFMRNHITWDTNGADQFLDVDVKLNISLEIYTQPFSLLPVSAVEKPGNLIMQSLVDKLVPLLLQQLLQDYNQWVQEQCKVSP